MLDEKVLKKANQELIENHKECCTTWLVQHGASVKLRNLYFRLYDRAIGPDNIRNFYHVTIEDFSNALVKGELDKIKQYTQQ